MGKKTLKSVESGGKTKSSTGRNRIDIIRSRVALLSGKDRVLMTMYLEKANTFRQMARLAGVNEATVARRIHKLTQRLLDGAYLTCLRHEERLSRLERNIASDYFLAGLGQQKISAKRRCTRYQVRSALRKIQELTRVEEKDVHQD